MGVENRPRISFSLSFFVSAIGVLGQILNTSFTKSLVALDATEMLCSTNIHGQELVSSLSKPSVLWFRANIP